MAPHSIVVYSVCKDKDFPLYMRAMMYYNSITDEIFNKLLHLPMPFCAIRWYFEALFPNALGAAGVEGTCV